MKKLVAVNENGLRIGEDHQNATLSNDEVEEMRQLHEDGASYDHLARRFGVSKWTVGRICRYERRAQTIFGFKKIIV